RGPRWHVDSYGCPVGIHDAVAQAESAVSVRAALVALARAGLLETGDCRPRGIGCCRPALSPTFCRISARRTPAGPLPDPRDCGGRAAGPPGGFACGAF